ncbi:major facilitator superfamily MFS_1 [Novosphingobium aromaticivorans DSM 12444]|uniref:Major facilitator superfamily MFS_1 n=1 Tax=Novosphingobium aromaticivorans (strain ATCC 700278 / DSM 12444 / CCUG 56034 / CIP 105152 / NBRC 16084 / F199) TaxID=279238 RepID=Q2GA78_NOVAD|nr:MFS transporter [Novosphingobium aromaticivorans]ABD25245.1 major facilitator superfamily MFS_1 [Novosphingobium aromaticivorans DSM 12444]SCX87797.1 Major Facilitator Superfamily protein [Novosphingobium aromaticivorans]
MTTEPRRSLAPGAWYALVLVALTNAMSLLDRQILAILAPAIRKDLQIGDAEMGLLYGTVFALFYALFSLPVGRLADGWVRTRLLAISLLFWSAATGLAGLASSFAMLALSRLGVGIGEAATQPAGTSLVYDFWPKHRRGFVMSVMASAIALGLGGSLVLGGVAAGWWDAAHAVGTAPFGLKGWQFAFLVAAAPGFVLAAFLWTLKEPVRGQMDGIETPPEPHPFARSLSLLGSVTPGFHWIGMKGRGASPAMVRGNLIALVLIALAAYGLTQFSTAISPKPAMVLGSVAINPHALQWCVIGLGVFVIVNLMQGMKLGDAQAFRVISRSPTVMMCIAVGTLQSTLNYGMMAFNPSFLIRSYGLSMQETALQFGLLSAGMGIVGPLVWGPLSDWLQQRFPGSGRAWVALFAMAVSPVLSFWVYYAADPGSFYARFLVYSFILTGWMPPLYAIMYDQVLPRMRGLTASLYLLVMTILGMGIGPYVVGLLSDATGSLRTAMLSINTVAIPIAVLMVLIARRAERDEAGLLERAGTSV